MTREELREAGYKRTGYSKCRACAAPIEWWLTPNERPAPYDLMPDPESEAVSHFVTCPNANRFRKEPQRCTPPTMQESLLFSEPSFSSPQSSSLSTATPAPPSVEQPKNKDGDESNTNR